MKAAPMLRAPQRSRTAGTFRRGGMAASDVRHARHRLEKTQESRSAALLATRRSPRRGGGGLLRHRVPGVGDAKAKRLTARAKLRRAALLLLLARGRRPTDDGRRHRPRRVCRPAALELAGVLDADLVLFHLDLDRLRARGLQPVGSGNGSRRRVHQRYVDP